MHAAAAFSRPSYFFRRSTSMSVPRSQLSTPPEASQQTYPFTLADLPYAYDALEPHIDQKTLQVHHRGHHGTYVKKLNEALAKHPDLHKLTLAELLRDLEQDSRGNPHRREEQRRRASQPRLLLERDGARARTAPAGRAGRSARKIFRILRGLPQEVQRRRRQAFRQRLGGAGAGSRLAKTRNPRPQGSRNRDTGRPRPAC